jgi:hypothetical protein
MRLSLIFCKVAVILSCLLALCACGGGTQRPAAKKALCEMDLPMQGNVPRPMRAGDWMRLLLIGKERSDGIYAEAACTGERIEHVPLPRDCEVQTPDPGVPEAVPLSENSVVERLMPEGRRLIWIMTHRFPNGDGFGPVAAVTLGKTKAEVQSLGFLRLRPMRVDLSLWNIGPKAVLVGEGEQCTDPKVASTCRRAANVLVYDRGRFHAPPIRRTQSGECIDAPWVEYKREADLTLENGWNRHMTIAATVSHDERYVVITEQVEVKDTDPEHPDIPPRDVRKIDTERFIHVEGPRFYTRQMPLWPRIIPTEGKTVVLDPNRR